MNIRDLVRLEKARRAQSQQGAVGTSATPEIPRSAPRFDNIEATTDPPSTASRTEPTAQDPSPGPTSIPVARDIDFEFHGDGDDKRDDDEVCGSTSASNAAPIDITDAAAASATVPKVLLSTDPLWVGNVLGQEGVLHVEEEYSLDEDDDDDDDDDKGEVAEDVEDEMTDEPPLPENFFADEDDEGDRQLAIPASVHATPNSSVIENVLAMSSSDDHGDAVSNGRAKRARVETTSLAQGNPARPASGSRLAEGDELAQSLPPRDARAALPATREKNHGSPDSAIAEPATRAAAASSDDWADRVLQLDSPNESVTDAPDLADDDYDQGMEDDNITPHMPLKGKRVRFSEISDPLEETATSSVPVNRQGVGRMRSSVGAEQLPEGFFDDPEEDARVRGVELPSERNRKMFLSDLARLNQAATEADRQKATTEHQQELDRFREQAKSEQFQTSCWTQFLQSARARAETRRVEKGSTSYDSPNEIELSGEEASLDSGLVETAIDPESAVGLTFDDEDDFIERAWRERSLRGS